jgi:DNA-binding NtrC family response regulator
VDKKLLVAIIDDELDIVNLFREALHNIKGVTIFTFTDATVALEHFRINNSAYGIVITDLRMSDINGLDLVYEVKKLNPSVRTLLMTAFEVNDDLFQQYIKNRVINGFLQKPIKLGQLHTEVIKQIDIFKRKSRTK